MAADRLDEEGHRRFVARHQLPRGANGKRHLGPGLEKSDAPFVHWAADSIFCSGAYWGINIEAMLGGLKPGGLDREWVLQRVAACRAPGGGGFAGSPGHDPHVLYTYSALQTLHLCGQHPADVPQHENLVQWLASLQQPSGAFAADEFGDCDTRFTYAALGALALLGALDATDTALAAEYILQCRAPGAGGFGMRPGAEPHAGQTFCCVAALTLCNRLAELQNDQLLLLWLSERLTADGGVNGRPGKRADVCYAWWVGATLSLLGQPKIAAGLADFILGRQCDGGGISAHPGDAPDLFHTHFGIAALGVFGHPGVAVVDPLFCLPEKITASFQHAS